MPQGMVMVPTDNACENSEALSAQVLQQPLDITFVKRRLGTSKANLKVLMEYPRTVLGPWRAYLRGRVP